MERMASSSGFLLANSWLLLPVGLFVAIRMTVSLTLSLVYIWNTHIKTAFTPRVSFKKKYGQWAVVTGCTAGIGEQFVHELASLGMDLILISRSLDKLNQQARQTERLYGVKTKVIVCDFLDRQAYREVLKQTQGLDIGFLVNNVGLNTDTGSRRLDEMSLKAVRDMVIVNSGAATLMTKVFLPGMMTRGRGCILNIGSLSGFLQMPFQAVYCSCKAYLRSISRATDEEVKASGVLIRCNNTQFVRTDMCKGNDIIYNFPIWTADPRAYAHSSVKTINTPDCGGTLVFDFMLWFVQAVNVLTRTEIHPLIIYVLICIILPLSKRIQD